MSKHTLQVHSENILPIIKKWLYSDREIFLRELISNACDALSKVKILQERGEASGQQEELKVEVKIDSQSGTLSICDNGIGMTENEVQKYIAQIAFSGAEEFMNKYANAAEKDQVIGHFGLGFYSAYMVAGMVQINTLSYQTGSDPVFWACDGSSDYELTPGTLSSRGTEVILHIEKENEEYLQLDKIREMLHHYCDFLPFPIYLNGEHLNTTAPLWVKAPSECSKEEYLAFYRHLYPHEEPPLFWIHLNADYPFRLKGILYFPKMHRHFDVNKSSIKLYCNRVFVSDNCKDVISNYLMPLRGVIDSPDIPLNVSRSYLQVDKTVRQLSGHISKKVADSLATLYRTEQERFLQCWSDIASVVKLGVLEDERFYERANEFLVWKSINGDWTTIEAYLERNREKHLQKIFYTQEERPSPMLAAYRQKEIEVLYANSYIDLYIISFLEKKLSPVTFQRIDANLDDSLLDKSREKTVLDAAGKTAATQLADFIRKKLQNPKIEVEAKSLSMDGLPGVVVMDERQRRMREYMNSLDPSNQQKMLELDKRTFIVNTNNPLMESIQTVDRWDPVLAQELTCQLYDMALLAQRELELDSVNDFVTRTTHVIQKLVEQLCAKKEA